MDPYEATKKVFSRIQSLDPENSSKIMGLLLIQDHGEKEMIRLAFGPESLLQSVVLKARQELGVSSISPNTNSRVPIPKGLKIPSSLSVSSLASPISSSSSPSWGASNFHGNPDELMSPNSSSDLIDEFQLQEQLSFLNDPPQQDSAELWGGGGPHRRSCSLSGGDDLAGSVLGWKPCLYYARGFCKNGASCRFLHGAGGGGGDNTESMVEQCHELLRSKSMQHQKMMAATQIMANRANSFSYSGNKSFNFLLQQQQNEYQRAAAALMIGEDMNKFSRSRLSRNEFLMNGGGGGQIELNHSSRQIYLTFPADSIFREEDVSNYFSIFGPVQDVRIPYQQKRMFGFVTFLYSDTVKIILAKGNPHFVCDSRVLVKPYKEKGKIPDKFRKQQHQLQQMERGDFSACNSPTGLDPRDPFENQLGPRMMYNNSDEALWRRKLEEQADMQQAIELHSKRLMNLQLDVKRIQHTRALSAGAAPFPSPVKERSYNQVFAYPDGETKENGCYSSGVETQITQQAVNDTDREKDEDHNDKGSSLSNEDFSLPESLEHNLPDNPFASPTKASAKNITMFTNTMHVGSPSSSLLSSSLIPATSSLDLTSSFKSCYFPMPRFPAGHGAIGM